MTELFTDPDFTVVGYLKSELEAAGIPAFIRNEYAGNSMAGIPLPLFWPVLCITRDEDLPAAKVIVAGFVDARKRREPATEADWICPKCGEAIPSSFEFCWKCGGDSETGKNPT